MSDAVIAPDRETITYGGRTYRRDSEPIAGGVYLLLMCWHSPLFREYATERDAIIDGHLAIFDYGLDEIVGRFAPEVVINQEGNVLHDSFLYHPDERRRGGE